MNRISPGNVQDAKKMPGCFSNRGCKMLIWLPMTPEFPLLYTENTILGELREDDVQDIFTLRSDEAHNRYLDRSRASSPDDALAFIRKIAGIVREKQGLFWAIRLKQDQAFVGTVALFGFNEERTQAELGYELLPRFKSRGLMKEVLPAVIAWSFETIKLQRVEAWTHKENAPSIRLLDINGFRKIEHADTRQAETDDYLGYRLANPYS